MGLWSLCDLHHNPAVARTHVGASVRVPLSSHPLLCDPLPPPCLQYSSVAHVLEDMNTLFRNAQLFNEETSLVHHDSITLGCLTCHTLKELWKEKAPATGEDLDELLAIMTSARVGSGVFVPVCVCVHACVSACVRVHFCVNFPSLSAPPPSASPVTVASLFSQSKPTSS